MIHRGQEYSEEITYADIAYKLESGVRDKQNDCTFRYCKESRKWILPKYWLLLEFHNSVDSACIWKFVASEKDFKASDFSLGRTISLQSVDFVVDFIPHKYVLYISFSVIYYFHPSIHSFIHSLTHSLIQSIWLSFTFISPPAFSLPIDLVHSPLHHIYFQPSLLHLEDGVSSVRLSI